MGIIQQSHFNSLISPSCLYLWGFWQIYLEKLQFVFPVGLSIEEPVSVLCEERGRSFGRGSVVTTRGSSCNLVNRFYQYLTTFTHWKKGEGRRHFICCVSLANFPSYQNVCGHKGTNILPLLEKNISWSKQPLNRFLIYFQNLHSGSFFIQINPWIQIGLDIFLNRRDLAKRVCIF